MQDASKIQKKFWLEAALEKALVKGDTNDLQQHICEGIGINIRLDTVFISTLGGALMMSKLCGETVHMQRAANHLSEYIEVFLKQPAG